MKLILTGATGFIGSNLLTQLSNDKNITKILLILKDISKLDSKYSKSKKIKILELDLIRQKIPEISNYNVLLHLADVIPSKGDVLNFSDNIKITENIINNIVFKKNVNKIIYTSTLDVYGKPVSLPITEDHPTNPLTLYGISKLANEFFIKKAAEIANINYLILRLSQVYGSKEPLVKVIPLFIKKMKNNQEIVLKNNGNVTRDWVYINDVVLIIKKTIYSSKVGIFNIATGNGFSLKQLVRLLGQILNKHPKLRLEKHNIDARPKIILSIEKANKYLDYFPQYDLEKGLKDYLSKTE